jgi:hypothetical protein
MNASATLGKQLKQSKTKETLVFDPFGLHASSVHATFHESSIPSSKTSTRRNPTLTPDDVVEATRPVVEIHHKENGVPNIPISPKVIVPETKPLTLQPPKVNIIVKTHENVTSFALNDEELEGSSEIFVEGSLSAQVTSSDATNNVPFCLTATTSGGASHIKFQPNGTYSQLSPQHTPTNTMAIVDIPKSELTFVPIGTYSLTEKILYMPLVSSCHIVTFVSILFNTNNTN